MKRWCIKVCKQHVKPHEVNFMWLSRLALSHMNASSPLTVTASTTTLTIKALHVMMSVAQELLLKYLN